MTIAGESFVIEESLIGNVPSRRALEFLVWVSLHMNYASLLTAAARGESF